MTLLYRALLLLSLAAPLFLLNDAISPVAVVAFAALCGIIFLVLDNNSLQQLGSRIRPAIIGVGVMLVLLLLQLVPSAPGQSHPIWKTASSALGEELGDRVSVDPGKTVETALDLLFLMSALLASAAVSSDPAQARMVHRSLCLAVCLTCVALMLTPLASSANLDVGKLSALATAALVVAASLLLHRSKASPASPQSYPELLLMLLGAVVGVGALAVLHQASSIVTAIGGVVLTAVFSLLPGSKPPRRAPVVLALAVALLMAALVVLVPRVLTDASVPLGNAVNADAIDSVRRMISDTPLFGTGGGTFSVLAEVYARDSSQPLQPPSLAAKLYVEYGPVGLAAIAFIWLLVCFELAAGALRRMRDRYLCASAAALSLVTAAGALFDASAASAAPLLIVALLLGVGLAQRESSAR